MRKLIPLLVLFAGAALAQPANGPYLLRIEPTRADFTLQNMSADESRLATQHAEYLLSLMETGKLQLAAQVFDPKGLWGIIIVNAPNQESARALLDADPGVKGKMFRGEVLPVRVVLEQPGEPAKPAVSVDAKTLESYSGSYKSEEMPLGIKAFVKDGKLYLQATGQPEFALKPTSNTRFEFSQAGVVVEFDSAASFTLKQAGMSYRYKKVETQ